METNTATETEAKRIAYAHLNKRYRILAPESEARVVWADFNPFRAVQAVCYVEWPATVAMREVTLVHTIHDGDTL